MNNEKDAWKQTIRIKHYGGVSTVRAMTAYVDEVYARRGRIAGISYLEGFTDSGHKSSALIDVMDREGLHFRTVIHPPTFSTKDEVPDIPVEVLERQASKLFEHCAVREHVAQLLSGALVEGSTIDSVFAANLVEMCKRAIKELHVIKE